MRRYSFIHHPTSPPAENNQGLPRVVVSATVLQSIKVRGEEPTAFGGEEEVPQLKPERLAMVVPQLISNQLKQIDFALV